MGLRIRKSIPIGKTGVKINFSKSGVGASAGVKGIRATKLTNGRTRTTFSLPETGITYVKDSSTNHQPEKNVENIGKPFKSIDTTILSNGSNGFQNALNNLNTELNNLEDMYRESGYSEKEVNDMMIQENKKINERDGITSQKRFYKKATGWQVITLIILFPASIIFSALLGTIFIPYDEIEDYSPLLFLAVLFSSIIFWIIYATFFSKKIKVIDRISKNNKVMKRVDFYKLLKNEFIYENYSLK
ncbi:DUF4236 domain-containing protein [Lactovum miscens]|uniref:DUF4236 domain-containing protein n=1 Tax=Lactovum miscens TaxID=190387 RepID=A0A841C7N5_9LACT|nr:DUF4236 domain-containing protein [Lactovum miscens]MBB5887748.1 hypothetical protein [Lactovum miscens]